MTYEQIVAALSAALGLDQNSEVEIVGVNEEEGSLVAIIDSTAFEFDYDIAEDGTLEILPDFDELTPVGDPYMQDTEEGLVEVQEFGVKGMRRGTRKGTGASNRVSTKVSVVQSPFKLSGGVTHNPGFGKKKIGLNDQVSLNKFTKKGNVLTHTKQTVDRPGFYSQGDYRHQTVTKTVRPGKKPNSIAFGRHSADSDDRIFILTAAESDESITDLRNEIISQVMDILANAFDVPSEELNVTITDGDIFPNEQTAIATVDGQKFMFQYDVDESGVMVDPNFDETEEMEPDMIEESGAKGMKRGVRKPGSFAGQGGRAIARNKGGVMQRMGQNAYDTAKTPADKNAAGKMIVTGARLRNIGIKKVMNKWTGHTMRVRQSDDRVFRILNSYEAVLPGEIDLEEGDELAFDVVEVHESIDGVGPKWDCVMMTAGEASNKAENGKRRVYPEATLRTAVEAEQFDGIPAYQRTDGEHLNESTWEQCGTWGKARWDDAKKAVVNTLTWFKDKYPSVIHQRIKTAIEAQRRDLIPVGVSITGSVKMAQESDGTESNIVERILQLRSCDPISFASAGGAVLSVRESQSQEDKVKILDYLTGRGIVVPNKFKTAWKHVNVAEGAAADFMLAQLKASDESLFAESPDLEAKIQKDENLLVFFFKNFMKSSGADVAPAADPNAGGQNVAYSQRVNEARETQLNLLAVEGVLNGSTLDEIQKKRIRTHFTGKAFDPDAIQTQIQESLDMMTAYNSKVPNGRVNVIADQGAKIQTAFNDFFFQTVTDKSERARLITNVSESQMITVDPHGVERSFHGLLRLAGADFKNGRLVQEAMDPDLVTQLLLIGINGRMAYEWGLPTAFDDWQNIVDKVPQFNYKPNKVMAYGGFGGWKTVAAGIDYDVLTDTGLSTESYTITKGGGYIAIPEEHMRNDNVGYIARLPERMIRYAKRILSKFVWDLVTDNGALDEDSVAVFHELHKNLTTDPLSNATLKKMIGMLQMQLQPGSTTDVLGTTPKYLATSFDPDKQELAYGMTTAAASANNMVASWAQAMGIQPIRNPHMSVDSNKAYLFGDKKDIAIIEVGFLDGQEIPVVETSQLAGVGAWFDSDTAKWKVKQAYNGTWVTYQGAVASIAP